MLFISEDLVRLRQDQLRSEARKERLVSVARCCREGSSFKRLLRRKGRAA